jgi:hypothetical protein
MNEAGCITNEMTHWVCRGVGAERVRSILTIENLLFPIDSQRLFNVVAHELADFL